MAASGNNPANPQAPKQRWLLVGAAGTGKSSIHRQFTRNEFSVNYISTIGIDFGIKDINVNEKQTKIQIWDSAGQERFATITSAYYRDQHAILMVINANADAKSFSEQVEKLNEYKQDIYAQNKNAVFFLIATHLDKTSEIPAGRLEAIQALSKQLDIVPANFYFYSASRDTLYDIEHSCFADKTSSQDMLDSIAHTTASKHPKLRAAEGKKDDRDESERAKLNPVSDDENIQAAGCCGGGGFLAGLFGRRPKTTKSADSITLEKPRPS